MGLTEFLQSKTVQKKVNWSELVKKLDADYARDSFDWDFAPVLLSRRGLKSTAKSYCPLKWTEERFFGSEFSPLAEDFRYEPGV